MEFSGERFIPGGDWSLENEHMHRYMAVQPLVQGLRVLDIASGEGYGTSILAQTAAAAVGVDISPDAVHHAQATYGQQKNLKFLTGSVTAIPCDDQSFDCVVSFETLEHLPQHDEMMQEIRRVLRQDGFLIISTPDKERYNLITGRDNEFHVRELHLSEFHKLLSKFFAHIDIYGQRFITTSSISRLNASLPETITMVTSGKAKIQAPLYHLAICSQHPQRPELPASIFIKNEQDIYNRDESKLAWASGVHHELMQEKESCQQIQNELQRKTLELLHADQKTEHQSLMLAEFSRLLEKSQIDLQMERQRFEENQHLQQQLTELIGNSFEAIKGTYQQNQSLFEKIKNFENAQQQARLSDERTITKLAIFDERLAAIHDIQTNLHTDVASLIKESSLTTAAIEQFAHQQQQLDQTMDEVFKQQQESAQKIHEQLLGLQDTPEQVIAIAHAVDRSLQENSSRQEGQNAILLKSIEHISLQLSTLAHHNEQLNERLSARVDSCANSFSKLQEIPHQIRNIYDRLNHIDRPWHDKIAQHPIAVFIKKTWPFRVLYLTLVYLLIKPLRVLRQTHRDRGRNFKFWIIKICRQGYYSTHLSQHSKALITNFIYASPARHFFKDLQHYKNWSTSRQILPILSAPADIEKHAYAEIINKLHFYQPQHPQISIIIPTYGKVDYTLRCLDSLCQHVATESIEVIVLDDTSHDPDISWLEKIPGLILINNDHNLGFVRNCNKGAQIAKGEFLCFLNNDTFVLENWLDALLEVFSTHSDAGIVGSKLIYPDGRLQEAGGIVWKDASAWNYGRFADHHSAAFNYLRETDYVSGASLLIKKDFFLQIGCFGEEYAPAYCEDSDLCFKSREAGRKVYYQPRSQIIHYEGISNGTDTSAGIKAYQVVNQKTFYTKWQQRLAATHWPNAECVFRARERGWGKKYVLVIDHYVPQPDRDAGSRSMYQFMQCMLELGYGVKLLPANLWFDPVYTSWYQRLGIEVIYGDACNGIEDYIQQNIEQFDVVFLSRPHIADPILSFIKNLRDIPVVYYGHDIHHCRMQQQQLLKPESVSQQEIDSMRDMEMRVWKLLDCISYPSPEEVAYLNEIGYAKKTFLLNPFHVEITASPTLDHRKNHHLIFVGGFAHSPNIDAAVWFVSKVLPLIHQSLPDVSLDLVGSNPSAAVLALKSPLINVTGYVSDAELYQLYAQARVAVIPLLYGAGIKGKVIEACQMGVPLVTTDVGVQGMPDLANIVDISTDPQTFANAVVHLLTKNDLWQHRSSVQQNFVRRNFSKGIMLSQIKKLLQIHENRSGNYFEAIAKQ